MRKEEKTGLVLSYSSICEGVGWVWIGFDTEYRVCAGLFSSIVSLEPALIGNETTKPESRARYALLILEAG